MKGKDFLTVGRLDNSGRVKVKQSSIRLLPLAGLALMTTALGVTVLPGSNATAQGDSCYMVTSSGQVVRLDKLCGVSKPSTRSNPNSAGTPNGASSVFQAKIKYRMGKTPVIDVTFNNQQTFEMIVDTGADGTLITRSMARALKLPVTGLGEFEMADGRVITLPMARVQSISVSGAEVRNVEVAIAEKTDIGLLGHDFFDRYDVKIKQHVVEFYTR